MTGRPSRIENFDLENLIGDIEGDMLLLDLAIAEALRQEDKSAAGQKEGITTLILNGDQVTALVHAKGRLYASVYALHGAFHEPKEAPDARS